jgi:hypothetical protein
MATQVINPIDKNTFHPHGVKKPARSAIESLQLTLLLSDAKLPDVDAVPELDPILELHRASDSYVTFHVLREGKMINDCSVKVDALANYFPQFRADLDRDSYFSLNGFYRPGYGHGLAGLPHALRNSHSARYLNCCFVDIDCHDRAFNFGTMVGRVISLQDQNAIPPASIFVRSGRGLWLLWILVDNAESELPPSAHAPRLLLWKAIQEELGRRLADIGADQAAHEVARITRVPGSINSNVEQRVKYLFPSADGKRGFTYTMEQLAESLRIELPRMRQHKARTSLPPSPRAVTGHRALAQHRFDDFMRLRELRGGFVDGTRNHAALIFAIILCANGFEESAIKSEVTKFARECHPPLTTQEVENALKNKRTYRKIRDQSIATWLHVTEQESRIIPR